MKVFEYFVKGSVDNNKGKQCFPLVSLGVNFAQKAGVALNDDKNPVFGRGARGFFIHFFDKGFGGFYKGFGGLQLGVFRGIEKYKFSFQFTTFHKNVYVKSCDVAKSGWCLGTQVPEVGRYRTPFGGRCLATQEVLCAKSA